MMVKTYFSFGQSHAHVLDGVTLDKDSIIQINSVDSGIAREKMFEWFGPKWSMQYDEKSLSLEYFPRGIVLIKDV